MTSSSDSSRLCISIVQSAPSVNAALPPTLAFKPLIPLPPTLYLLLLHPHHRIKFLAVSLQLLLPLPPESLMVLQWNTGGVRTRSTELPHFLSSHPVDLICIQKFNLNSSSSFQILDFLLCNLMAPTPGLVFFLLMPHTLVASSSSFLSGRAYLSLNFLPPLFLRLTPTLIM